MNTCSAAWAMSLTSDDVLSVRWSDDRISNGLFRQPLYILRDTVPRPAFPWPARWESRSGRAVWIP